MYVSLTLKTIFAYRVLHRLSVLTDLHFHSVALDPVLFPDIPSGVKVHSGFAIEHKKTANQILAEVERLMDVYSSTHVVLVRLHYCDSLPSGHRTYFFGIISIDRSLTWRSYRGTRHVIHDG